MTALSIQGTLVRTFIYTVGHFFIAFCCVVIIANASPWSALTDSLVEPLLNSGWYFVVDRLVSIGLRSSFIRMVIYTIGHFFISFYCVMTITNATVVEALADSTVEPLLNAGWYLLLDKIWTRFVSVKA